VSQDTIKAVCALLDAEQGKSMPPKLSAPPVVKPQSVVAVSSGPSNQRHDSHVIVVQPDTTAQAANRPVSDFVGTDSATAAPMVQHPLGGSESGPRTHVKLTAASSKPKQSGTIVTTAYAKPPLTVPASTSPVIVLASKK
jgi:hypothetical protein